MSLTFQFNTNKSLLKYSLLSVLQPPNLGCNCICFVGESNSALIAYCSHCAAKADGREKQEDYQLGDGGGGDGGGGGGDGDGHRHGRAC